MRDNISAAIFVHTAHDKHRHADNSAIYTNFFAQCVHPENRVYCISEGAINEERNVAALTNLGYHEVHRAHSGIQTTRTITAAVAASSVRALTFLCA